MRIAIVVAVVVVVASCSDSSSPVAPTVSPPPPPPPPPPTIEIDFPFDDAFWRAFVYNAHDDPGDLSGRVSWVLPTTSPNFYVRRSTQTDTMPGCGRRWSLDNLAYMERMIPRLVEQLTGERYRGEVINGCEDRQREGWITIVSATLQENPNLSGHCGWARVGAYGDGEHAGRIWINEEPNYTCTRSGLEEILAHELGHAMGFRHVSDGFGYVMSGNEFPNRDDFTVKERQHAQHAYKRGRHAPYCGTALACSSAAFGFSHGPTSLGTPPELP